MNFIELLGLAGTLVMMLHFAHRWFQLRLQPVSAVTGSDIAFKDIPSLRLPDSRWPLARALRTMNINLGPLVFSAGLGVLGLLGFSVLMTFFPGQIPVAVIGAAATTIVGYHLISDLAALRVRKLEKGLVEALDLMRASYSTGMSARQAIQVAARTAKGNLKIELVEVVTRLDMGCTVEQAVARIQSRFRCIGTQLFAQALIARYESDSDFSAMLASVSRIMHDRIRQQLTIDAQLSGTRYAALMCALMPYLLVPVFIWQHPGWLDTLAEHPRGPTYLGLALLLQLSGFLWLRHLLRTWR